ncbi:MAG: hypothetical protein U0N62_03055 [Hydrogeniiclostridium sp.]
MRPYPDNIKRLAEFRRDSLVGIGWPSLGDLSGKTKEELKVLISGEPYRLTGNRLGSSYATADIFVNRMQKGDLLLVPDGEDIFFAEVTGDYTFSAALCSEGYPHQRKVKWLKNVSRSDLSMALRSSLKAHQTAADVSRHYEEIEALAFGKESPALGVQKTIPVSYPLRRDFTVRFEVPENLTKGEAKRLASFFEGLYFEEE